MILAFFNTTRRGNKVSQTYIEVSHAEGTYKLSRTKGLESVASVAGFYRHLNEYLSIYLDGFRGGLGKPATLRQLRLFSGQRRGQIDGSRTIARFRKTSGPRSRTMNCRHQLCIFETFGLDSVDLIFLINDLDNCGFLLGMH